MYHENIWLHFGGRYFVPGRIGRPNERTVDYNGVRFVRTSRRRSGLVVYRRAAGAL